MSVAEIRTRHAAARRRRCQQHGHQWRKLALTFYWPGRGFYERQWCLCCDAEQRRFEDGAVEVAEEGDPLR